MKTQTRTAAWRSRHGLTLTSGAALIGVGRRHFAALVSGDKSPSDAVVILMAYVDLVVDGTPPAAPLTLADAETVLDTA